MNRQNISDWTVKRWLNISTEFLVFIRTRNATTDKIPKPENRKVGMISNRSIVQVIKLETTDLRNDEKLMWPARDPKALAMREPPSAVKSNTWWIIKWKIYMMRGSVKNTTDTIKNFNSRLRMKMCIWWWILEYQESLAGTTPCQFSHLFSCIVLQKKLTKRLVQSCYYCIKYIVGRMSIRH